MDVLIVLLSAVVGIVLCFAPFLLMKPFTLGYFDLPIIGIFYVTGLGVGVLYWKPLIYISLGAAWSYALLPIIIGTITKLLSREDQE